MNGLELAKKAVALWRQQHGDASLYLQCQRFDGFYTQSGWAGHWNSRTYASALIASRAARAAGRIYTTDLNDPRIEAGERVYYEFGQYGHVCMVIGRDSGGLLVTNTARAGDDLGQLGNHVKISHAHTLGLKLIGVSSRDGDNLRITGVDMWRPGGGTAAATPTPAGQDDRIRLANWAWYRSAAEAVALRNPNGREWNGQPYLSGDYDVLGVEGNGAVKIRANDGSTVWAHPSARQHIYYVGTAPAPAPAAPAREVFDVPGVGQYFYWQYQNALNGDYAANQLLRGGQTLEVVENPGTGPVRVRAADGGLVWVGTRRNPARTRR